MPDTTKAERELRYAEALSRLKDSGANLDAISDMAAASAELADLRAKVARVEDLADAYDRIVVGGSSAALSIREALAGNS